jgi:peptidoglycan hydrolase-like protein with peptidoglycan-binding domain
VIGEKEAGKERVTGHEAPAEVQTHADAKPSGRFSGQGRIPPVAPLRDGPAAPTASDRAFGEVARAHGHDEEHDHEHDEGELETEEDASGKPGPKGTRFSGDGELGDVERGVKTLKIGDSGHAVRKVQQALFELNLGPINVTGTYDQLTADAVQAFQQQRGLAHKDGKLDSTTFQALEKEFFDISRYAKAAKHAPPGVHNTPKGTNADQVPVLLAETNALDADAKAEANAVISPSKSNGVIGPFQDPLPAGSYAARLEKLLLEKVADEYKDAAADKKHHDKGLLFSMDQMVDVGNAAKDQVDSVFGSWAVGGPMKAGTTLNDRYEVDTAAQSKMDAPKKLREAKIRVRYFMNTDRAFSDLDKEHSVDRTREDAIIDSAIDKVAAAKEQELLLIVATSSAATDKTGSIKLQRLRSGNEDQDRDTLWRKFGTMIHEYIHSIAHPQWREYKSDKSKADSQAGHTLTEGVTELLTRTVVSQINLNDKKLRKQVLGKIDDDGEEPDLGRSGKYTAPYLRAQELVGVAGIYNLYAAYFLGETKLIGA